MTPLKGEIPWAYCSYCMSNEGGKSSGQVSAQTAVLGTRLTHRQLGAVIGAPHLCKRGGLSPSVQAEIIHKLTASYLNC